MILMALTVSVAAFVPEVRRSHATVRSRCTDRISPACRTSAVPESLEGVPPETIDSVHVALFGVGDLRTDDHEGLRTALKRAAESDTSRILPLIVLDKGSIANLPGALAHTEDTACMVAEAIQDLQKTLADVKIPLHVDVGSESLLSGLSKVLQSYLVGTTTTNVCVHVCDHGVVDNSMMYSPLAHLQSAQLPPGWTVQSWTCNLRTDPWVNLESLPNTYTDYTRAFPVDPHLPVPFPVESLGEAMAMTLEQYTTCPTSDDLKFLFQATMNLDPDQCREERNSGLYGTHWGGLSASSMGETKVTEVLRVFVEECQEQDDEFARRGGVPRPERNEKSLEHATMIWNLRGDGTKGGVPDTTNVIAGELLTRYLLAPLMLGTLSPRRLWWSVKGTPTAPLFTSPLRTLVETREWHKLLAAKQFMLGRSEGGMSYKFWRWHGFLARYGEQTVRSGKSSQGKEGILFIHGFGASANQWQKSVDALSSLGASETGDISTIECLAPDLIGFGQSEKPPITYSGFTWEAYTGDFIKEVAIAKNGWNSFAMGGNSIGGFVAMCAAANDATTDADAISGCGAPGTGRCTGVVLMNAAGVIQSREDVATIEASVKNRSELRSVAQVIASDGLGPCK